MSTYNHTGQVVSDLERSKRFYLEVLGFRFWYEIQPADEPTAKLSCLTPPLGVTASYLTLDGFVLELMHYSAPGAMAPFRRRTMNEPGLTHLSISVDDVRSTADKAVEYGGQIIEESAVGAALFIRDPDGQLLELLPVGYRASLPPETGTEFLSAHRHSIGSDAASLPKPRVTSTRAEPRCERQLPVFIVDAGLDRA